MTKCNMCLVLQITLGFVHNNVPQKLPLSDRFAVPLREAYFTTNRAILNNFCCCLINTTNIIIPLFIYASNFCPNKFT